MRIHFKRCQCSGNFVSTQMQDSQNPEKWIVAGEAYEHFTFNYKRMLPKKPRTFLKSILTFIIILTWWKYNFNIKYLNM